MADRKVTDIAVTDAGNAASVLGVESGVVKRFNVNSLPVPYSAVTGRPTLGTLAGLSYPGGTAFFLRADGTFASVPSSGGTDSWATFAAGTTSQYLRGDKTWQTLNSSAVGLGNVENVSRATILASPALTGTPTAPTATVGTNTTQVATTAFVLANAGSGGGLTNPMNASGDMIYGGTSGTPTRLPKGSNEQVLTLDTTSGQPRWKASTGGAASNATSVQYDSINGPARNVFQKLRDTKSVRDFGAVGTGPNVDSKLSSRYATLADAQAVYPFATSLNDQIDWAALQAAVYWMNSNGQPLSLDGAGLNINNFVRTSGYWNVDGKGATLGGQFQAKGRINDGDTVPVDLTYPTSSNPGPLGGCCIYVDQPYYYMRTANLSFQDFRFCMVFINDPNSPIWENINFNYSNCGTFYYLGCQNPRYVNCGGGQLGVMHISSVTAFPSGHPNVGNDNYYSDNVTIRMESGYNSIGGAASSGFDNFIRDSILRPNADSITQAGTNKYTDRNGNVYTDPFYLNATGRIVFMPFRNLRDCFSFTMEADSRGGLRYGYALVNTEIAALELYANNYEQLFQNLPDSDATASLLTCGSVYSGTMQMASQIDYIDKEHPMVSYTGRGQSRGSTDGSGIMLLGTSILFKQGDKPIGFDKGILRANNHYVSIRENFQNRTQGRADTNAPADFIWDFTAKESFTNKYPGRTVIESEPFIIDLPFRTSDNIRRVHAFLSLNRGFAGFIDVTVLNANELMPADSASYYWDNYDTEVFQLAQTVNNGDKTVILNGTPRGNYSSARYAKWQFDNISPKGFIMDGYVEGNTVKVRGEISGLSGPVAAGSNVRRAEKLAVLKAFTQNWIRLSISSSSANTLPFHSQGSLGIRNMLASSDVDNFSSPNLTVILTLRQIYSD